MKRIKVLIIGQAFNSVSGGGITLSSLFKGWNPEDLAIAISGAANNNLDFSLCHSYYRLGSEERKFSFPLNMIKKKYASGPVNHTNSNKTPFNAILGNHKIRNMVIQTGTSIIQTVLEITGLIHKSSKIGLSDRFISWVSDFSPDIIYTQLGNYEIIGFIDEIIYRFNKPLVIHIMDDWITTINRSIIFKKYWHIKLNGDFHAILSKASLCLSISDAMSREYKVRFGFNFFAFHNPVELSEWDRCAKKNYAIDRRNIKLLYAGRLGIGISDALERFINALAHLNDGKNEVHFNLFIQSANISEEEQYKLKHYDFVTVLPPVDYKDIPNILSSHDILILPTDFKNKGQKFLKYSMPTKVSEYMASGTPVVLFCPPTVSLHNHAKENQWAFLIDNWELEFIQDRIRFFANNQDSREFVSKNALQFAKNNFDAVKVRQRFHEKLLEVSRNKIKTEPIISVKSKSGDYFN